MSPCPLSEEKWLLGCLVSFGLMIKSEEELLDINQAECPSNKINIIWILRDRSICLFFLLFSPLERDRERVLQEGLQVWNFIVRYLNSSTIGLKNVLVLLFDWISSIAVGESGSISKQVMPISSTILKPSLTTLKSSTRSACMLVVTPIASSWDTKSLKGFSPTLCPSKIHLFTIIYQAPISNLFKSVMANLNSSPITWATLMGGRIVRV